MHNVVLDDALEYILVNNTTLPSEMNEAGGRVSDRRRHRRTVADALAEAQQGSLAISTGDEASREALVGTINEVDANLAKEPQRGSLALSVSDVAAAPRSYDARRAGTLMTPDGQAPL